MNIERERKKAAAKLMKQAPGDLKPIDFSNSAKAPKWMTRCFRNNRYTIMIDDNALTTHGKAIKALIQKHDDTPITFHWREMQKIKNEIFGRDVTAIEYYPAESQLIDQHNIYWMWIFPKDVIPIPCF